MRMPRAAAAREEIAPPDNVVLARSRTVAWPYVNRAFGNRILAPGERAICSMAFSQFAPRRDSGNGRRHFRRMIFLL
jgi:hypothetical protein